MKFRLNLNLPSWFGNSFGFGHLKYDYWDRGAGYLKKKTKVVILGPKIACKLKE